ncbi:MAG: hypothetical protein ACK2U1_24465, partial [Anaerolineales bacterium]
GSLGMLLGGNIGNVISTDSIPRPLYHYTLPLYGVVTLVLYLLATRLIRPARRWNLKAKDVLIGFATVGIFILLIGIGFAVSSNRYENVSIFTAPTPFVPVPEVQMAIQVGGIPVSDDEAIEIYVSALQTMQQDEFLSNADIVTISRQTYPEPSSPELLGDSDQADLVLSENISEGITVSVENLPFDLIWVDYFEQDSPEDTDKPEKPGDILILLGTLNPMKTGLIELTATIYYQDHTQNLHFQLSNTNGIWQVIQYEGEAGITDTGGMG